MFDTFGEMNSYEEINKTAAGLLNEGDKDNILVLAQENGIDKEDAEDYIAGDIPELTTLYAAVYGRLAVLQEEETKKKGIAEVMMINTIYTTVKGMCSDEQFAVAVMKKGNRVSDIINKMRSQAQENKSGNVGICCGTDRELEMIVRVYYLDGKKECESKIKELYKK